MMKINNLCLFFLVTFLSSCSLAPGMHMTSTGDYVYIESLDTNVPIIDINTHVGEKDDASYKIGNGDQLSITVWGLQEIFPISNINTDQNLRRVDSNGNIYFPYVVIKVLLPSS